MLCCIDIKALTSTLHVVAPGRDEEVQVQQEMLHQPTESLTYGNQEVEIRRGNNQGKKLDQEIVMDEEVGIIEENLSEMQRQEEDLSEMVPNGALYKPLGIFRARTKYKRSSLKREM